MRVSLSLAELMILAGAAALSMLVATAPGYVGSYQYLFGLALSAFDFAAAAGVVAASIMQLVLFASLTVIGIGI